MTAKEIAQKLVEGWAQLAAQETIAAGLSSDEVVTEYYYTVDPETPEDEVQAEIKRYEGYFNREVAQSL